LDYSYRNRNKDNFTDVITSQFENKMAAEPNSLDQLDVSSILMIKGERSLLRMNDILSALIKLCNEKIEKHESLEDVQFVCDQLLTMLKYTDKVGDILKSVRHLNEVLKKTLISLKTEVSALEGKVSALQTEVNGMRAAEVELRRSISDLEERLRLSDKQLAGLELRHILRRTPSLIYKQYFPTVDLSKRDYTLAELQKRLRNNSATQKELGDLLRVINFDENDTPTAITNIIEGYDLNRIAHPEDAVTTHVTTINDFELILQRLEVTGDDAEDCRRIARAYFKLRE